MPNRKNEFAGNFILLLVILVFLFLMHSIFVAGPLRAYEKEDNLHLEAFVENTDHESARFLDRYQNEDGLYYIVLADEKKEAKIVVFKKDLSEIESFPYVSKEEVAKKLDQSQANLHYAYLDQQLLFELRENGYTKYLDAQSLEVIEQERE